MKARPLIVGLALGISVAQNAVAQVAGAVRMDDTATTVNVVAVPVAQLQVRAGRLVLPDTDRRTLGLQPAFVHAPITRTQSSIVERAQRDVDRAQQAVARLERMGAPGTGQAGADLERRILVLRQSQKEVKDRMAEMDAADAAQWQAAEAEVRRAAARLRAAMRDAGS
ncbi:MULTISPECIES: hypothetical protein [unclassified Variovorax]|uniref:hypothetical protein n=1 Tax=unclassified Variovorax TaxID=663243 RepID=UPI000D13D91C|nr:MULTISPECIES: hypothetical protein [unclassified Variovorax]AVQ85623.1 hypothetical protein C4F17_31995 [Variovorax sp. PMC12]QRY35251.1 hypothetical protein JVX96_28340 [Variovorax sp. PDNC026]